jgi:multimeric flavodoxin WrbA
MNTLILDGSLEGQDVTTSILRGATDELEIRGSDVETVVLHKENIKGCIGCFRCWDTTPGICSGVKGDNAESILKKVIASDLLIFITPLTFGGYSSELKKIIERFLGLLQPGIQLINGESHHKKRYDRYPSTISLAIADNPTDEEIGLFKALADRHSLNFYPPKHRAEVFSTSDNDNREKLKSIIDEMEAAS